MPNNHYKTDCEINDQKDIKPATKISKVEQ